MGGNLTDHLQLQTGDQIKEKTNLNCFGNVSGHHKQPEQHQYALAVDSTRLWNWIPFLQIIFLQLVFLMVVVV